MAGTVWSGHLTFGLISIPVRLTPAARSESISFNMLHRDDLSRLKQHYTCLVDGMIVTKDATVKGYEYEKDKYVVIEPSEIDAIQPQTSQTMELLEFVPSSEVDPIIFDSSYYITPEKAGEKPYSLLAEAMKSGNYFGVAKLFMHNREYTVVIRPYKEVLALHTMFYQDEVRDHGVKLTAKPQPGEVEMALGLISAMADDWSPEKYTDGFVDSLKTLIQSKIEGKPLPKAEKVIKKAAALDIQEALKLSIEAMKKQKEQKAKKDGK